MVRDEHARERRAPRVRARARDASNPRRLRAGARALLGVGHSGRRGTPPDGHPERGGRVGRRGSGAPRHHGARRAVWRRHGLLAPCRRDARVEPRRGLWHLRQRREPRLPLLRGRLELHRSARRVRDRAEHRCRQAELGLRAPAKGIRRAVLPRCSERRSPALVSIVVLGRSNDPHDRRQDGGRRLSTLVGDAPLPLSRRGARSVDRARPRHRHRRGRRRDARLGQGGVDASEPAGPRHRRALAALQRCLRRAHAGRKRLSRDGTKAVLAPACRGRRRRHVLWSPQPLELLT